MRTRLRVLVSGMIARHPHQGGAAWAVLQYVLGLRELGHDVYLVEPMPARAILPESATLAASVNATYFRAVVERFELGDRAALLLKDTHETVGLPYATLQEVARGCDILLNISGMLTDPVLRGGAACRVYLDLDPAFIQLWQVSEGIDMRFDGHTHFVTIGQAIGTAGCTLPTCGRTWIPTVQPVVLSRWPNRPPAPDGAAWTTIANWRAYGSITHDGVFYGQKVHSLRPLLELPGRTAERLDLALSIDPAEVKDLAALRSNGWNLLDPRDSAGTPDRYQRFIEASKGEFGVAKGGYIASRCGWFSDRSACYLASGRPVVAQDTGFGPFLPTGDGLLSVRDLDGAIDALERVARDYPRHCARARGIAEDHLRSDHVLTRLLDRIAANP